LSFRGAPLGASPESISRQSLRLDGFRARGFAAPRNSAKRIARIRPISNANPHLFYEERSEVASDIRALASRLRTPPSSAADVR
jgi:hypothetical protein